MERVVKDPAAFPAFAGRSPPDIIVREQTLTAMAINPESLPRITGLTVFPKVCSNSEEQEFEPESAETTSF